MANKPTNVVINIQKNTERTIYATWKWDKSNTDHYEVEWYYGTGDGVSFLGNSGTVKYKNATYTAPENATSVAFYVKPISTTKTVDNKEVSYWTASWSTEVKYWLSSNPPSTPPAPTVTIEGSTLSAVLDNLDLNAKEIEFQIIQDDSKVIKTGTATINMGAVAYACTIVSGCQYKVRCRAKRDGKYSNWSAYSNTVGTKPSVPTLETCKASSKTSIRLTWTAPITAETYSIEYANERGHLEGSNAVTRVDDIEGTSYELAGLETGKIYYCRVRAKNKNGESGWSNIMDTAIGSKPEAPTTWSSTSTAIIGESVYMNWIHNCEDKSTEIRAELSIEVTNTPYAYDQTIEIMKPEGEEDLNSMYEFLTSTYDDGTIIKWKVRTQGATEEYGEWSAERQIRLYDPPSLWISIHDKSNNPTRIVESFPFYILGSAGPLGQNAVTYHTSIIANDTYETIDEIGNKKTIRSGQEIFSYFHNVSDFPDLLLPLMPSDVDLENNMSYTIICRATMNSGLTAEDTEIFTVELEDEQIIPNAEIFFDKDALCCHIRPYCGVYRKECFEVIFDETDGKFYRTEKKLDDMIGRLIEGVRTETYEDEVYYGDLPSGAMVYFTIGLTDEILFDKDIKLSVYRREYDGRFVEIATGINNDSNCFITDPHPSLDYARYRVVGISDSTGAVGYTDISGVYTGVKSIIIQWDEIWNDFDVEPTVPSEVTWAGSMLKLPYNIDISDKTDIDVSLIEYIGRSHPVSYYGTQLGVTSTWSVDVPKSDKETLYALRRLSIWTGDVYVREPSGSGYWANISVSYSQNHCETVIPVTLEIRRVEGGI